MSQDSLLAGGSRLAVGDAVAAIICVDADGYLMQLRDARPDIWYPGHRGLFGGGVEPGEDPLQALWRELYEELELSVTQAEFFARIDFDLSGLGLPRYYRSYYVVRITRDMEARLQLREGAARQVFPGSEILRELKVTPYDAFALFLHHQSARLIPPP